MKVVRKTYIKCLSFLLTLLGFAACDEIFGGKEEYGTPSATYKVKGTVISAQTKSPIQNVQVVMSEKPKFYVNAYGDTVPYASYYESDTAYTSSDGTFSVKTKYWDALPPFYVDFTDPYGNHLAKRDSIAFNNPQYENGDGHWYSGEATHDMGTVALAPRSTGNDTMFVAEYGVPPAKYKVVEAAEQLLKAAESATPTK